MSRGVRRWGVLLAMAALAGGLGYGGWRLREAWRHRTALVEIRAQIQAGRHGVAARNLAELLDREPGSDEVAYLLGVCEKARGRAEPAEEAWARIPPGSAFAAPAIVGRGSLLVDQGRFADAERLLIQAGTDPRIDAFELRRFLSPLFWHQGRIEEALRLIEANWEELNRAGQAGSEKAVEQVRMHVAVSLGTASVQAVETFLERAERLAPRDDRVWLGKANLAIRRGDFEQAARWIDACLRRHTEDVPIWRARLDWALATGRAAEVREALAHLPAAEATPAQVDRLAAWLAARRGDAASERQALERLIAADPGDGAALDRLAELAIQDHQPGRAAEFRSKKSALDPLKSAFKELFLRNQPVRDAEEMARLAERLGRSFEARALWSLANATDPSREEPRGGARPAGASRHRRRRTRADPGRGARPRARCHARRRRGAVIASGRLIRSDPVPGRCRAVGIESRLR